MTHKRRGKAEKLRRKEAADERKAKGEEALEIVEEIEGTDKKRGSDGK